MYKVDIHVPFRIATEVNLEILLDNTVKVSREVGSLVNSSANPEIKELTNPVNVFVIVCLDRGSTPLNSTTKGIN